MPIYSLGPKTAIVDTAQSIYDTLEDTRYSEIQVLPGTYDFNGIATDLTFYSGQRIKFVGDVIFQNVRLRTQTKKDGDFYADHTTSKADWDGGTSRWDRDGGGAWSGDSTWKIFVRDAWYDITSFPSNAEIDPVVSYYGNAAADERYVLCVPTQNLVVEGTLKMQVDDSPAQPWVYFKGLAWSDLSKFQLQVYRTSETAIAGTTYFNAIEIQGCCVTRLPHMTVSHIKFSPTATAHSFPFIIKHCYQCSCEGIHLQNFLHDTAQDGNIYGMEISYCQGLRFERVFISQLARKSGDASDHTYGIVTTTDSYSCNVNGTVTALYSSAGSIYYSYDDGTNNSLDIIQEAA